VPRQTGYNVSVTCRLAQRFFDDLRGNRSDDAKRSE
jgi:hypothetical protein